jgi:signal transduction histidine kinase
MDGVRLNSPDSGERRSVSSRQPRELALTTAILITDLFFFSNITAPQCTWGQRLLEVGCAILGYGALRLRHSSPVLAYGLGWIYAAGPALLTILGVFQFMPFFVLLVTLFAIASDRPLRVSCLALAASAVPIALAIWFNVEDQAASGYQLSTFIASAVFYLVVSAAACGAGMRSRSAQCALEHHRRAVEHHRRELARAAEAAHEERLRIARELHDILGHTITIMVLQASGARRILATDPAGADDALSRVEQVGKEAMGDVRRMLTLVRSPAPDEDGASQRGLDDIEGLLGHLLRAGITARLQVHGSPIPVAESVSRTVFRIVREATTNIIKHAGPGSVAIVRLTWGSDLQIEIVDDGGGKPEIEAAAFSTGQGLLGLKERVAVFGGKLTAGPHNNGFRVLVSLPLRSPASYVAKVISGDEE